MNEASIRRTIVEDRLRGQLSNLERKLFRVMEEVEAVSIDRLSSSNHIRKELSKGFAARHSDLFEIVKRLNRQGFEREFLAWKTPLPVPPEAPTPPTQATPDAPQEIASVMTADTASNALESPPINSEIAARAGQLVLLLKSGWRYVEWLSQMGFPEEWIAEVQKAYPNLIRRAWNNGYQVWLIEQPESQEHPPAVAPRQTQPDIQINLSAEDLARMKWRPGGKRGAVHPDRMLHRSRHPLVNFN